MTLLPEMNRNNVVLALAALFGILWLFFIWNEQSLKRHDKEKRSRATNELLQWLAWAPIEYPPARNVSSSEELSRLIPRLITTNTRYRNQQFEIDNFLKSINGDIAVIDAWNRRVEIFQTGMIYELRSAGADGVFFTDDDLVTGWLGGREEVASEPCKTYLKSKENNDP